MPDSVPTPPTTLPDDLVATLGDCSPEQLRQVARYAETLANHREQMANHGEAADKAEPDERSEDRPDDVPPKATITIKEINDNRYYYWQWREGDRVKSTYKSPVNPDE
ncbi:hypothetical protein [Halomarina litorea]|uniref:hypothetical protein n=1 Tax=Halomarina litorea TaxID=2961595 RepID=UPI0020C31E20|nr:hypothetical protein [Halomarina sp. BCD28]